MNTSHPDLIAPTNTNLRYLNYKAIQKFLEAKTDAERLARIEMFTEDCSYGANLPGGINVEGYTPKLTGKDVARACIEWNVRYLPEQVFVEPVIYQSADPRLYFVIAKHDGYIDFPAYGKRRYNNNFFMLRFVMNEGLIREYFEYSNMLKLYDTLGVAIPVVVKPNGWPSVTQTEISFNYHQLPKLRVPEMPEIIFADEEENALRQKNIDALRQYVDARLPEQRSVRWDLFTSTGTTGAAGGPVVMGKDKARACTEWNMLYFPDTVFNNNVLYQTQDPNLFMVESDGDCYISYPAYGEAKRYLNKFWHTFRMENGRIMDYYEFSNSLMIRLIFGLEVPQLDIPAGWPEV